jgi:hypothetical protein
MPNDDELVRLASALTGVRRRAAIPPRTWIALDADSTVARAKGDLVFANTSLDRFLVNVGPWRAALRVEGRLMRPGGVELTVLPLRPVRTLELLADSSAIEEVRLDGRRLEIDPLVRAPHLTRCLLTAPLRPGRTYRVTCRGSAPADRVWVNPVLVEAAKFVARRRVYIPAFWTESMPAGTFPDLIAGNAGVTTHVQPFAVRPAIPEETDEQLLARARRVMLGRRVVRRADLAYLVRELVPDVARVECSTTCWGEEIDGWLTTREGELIVVRPAVGADPATVRAATERFLRSHLPAGLPTRVELFTEGRS